MAQQSDEEIDAEIGEQLTTVIDALNKLRGTFVRSGRIAERQVILDQLNRADSLIDSAASDFNVRRLDWVGTIPSNQ